MQGGENKDGIGGKRQGFALNRQKAPLWEGGGAAKP